MAELTSEQILQLDESRQGGLIAAASAGAVIATLAVILRFVCRHITKTPYHADDWWIIVSLILYYGTITCVAIAVVGGAGRHAFAPGVDAIEYVQVLIGSAIIYFLNILTIKLSLLTLYTRIFIKPWFLRTVWVVYAALVAMTIAAVIVCVAQCIPLSAAWAPDPNSPARCVDFGRFSLAMGALNILSDFVILALPVPVILKLKTSRTRKWLIAVTFAIGGAAFVVCFIRLFFVLQVLTTLDPTYDTIPSAIISTVEVCVGIVAVCVPCYRPLYNLVVHGRAKGSNARANQQNGGSEESNESGRQQNIRLQEYVNTKKARPYDTIDDEIRQ